MGQLPTKDTLLGKSPAGFIYQIAIPPSVSLSSADPLGKLRPTKNPPERIQAKRGVAYALCGFCRKVTHN